ncbi:uncharacterized protein LOC117782851 [Drosophila innubila]|uniref:uncharacterized protein LOC117782851 n=1 Tax=Drosophila innubila TaxID=198719 RepID=UPI00148CF5CD|nr:uncharacterized protein LOC117782851 [Drosophila innubila]
MWTLYMVLLCWIPLGCTADYLINQVVRESSSSMLVIRQDLCPQNWLQQLLVEPPVPVVLQSLTNSTPTAVYFSRVLHLVCFRSMDVPEEQLTTVLQSIRRERSIFYVASGISKSTSHRLLQLLLRQCYRLRILQVIGLLAEDEGRFYYRYRPYPEFEVEQHLAEKRPFYVEQFPNMHRKPLIVLPDQKHPRTIIYTDWRTGSQVLAGSVGRFMRTLAWKLNATLQYPEQVKKGQILHSRELMTMVEELHVDVPAGLVSLLSPEQLPHISYPFELSHICLMIPLAQPIPIRDIYLILCNPQHILIALVIVCCFGWLLSLHRHLSGQDTNLVDFLLNDVALRGLLGQSFGQHLQTSVYSNWIYLLLGFLGLNLSSIHEAALGTLLTHPPKHFQPRSFADVQRVRLPLVLDAADLPDDSQPRFLSVPLLAVSTSELNRLRDNMNMSHVYFASRLKWTLLSAQQKYFPQEVFLYSMDACVSALSLMTFQLPNNSWFEEPISRLTLDARATGLFQHWAEMHFYDMAAAGLISFSDPINRQTQRIGGSLRLEDLHWIGIGYGVLLTIALTVFGLEKILKVSEGKKKKFPGQF